MIWTIQINVDSGETELDLEIGCSGSILFVSPLSLFLWSASLFSTATLLGSISGFVFFSVEGNSSASGTCPSGCVFSGLVSLPSILESHQRKRITAELMRRYSLSKTLQCCSSAVWVPKHLFLYALCWVRKVKCYHQGILTLNTEAWTPSRKCSQTQKRQNSKHLIAKARTPS